MTNHNGETDMSDDFVKMIQDAKAASVEYLASIGVEDDLSNAVMTPTLGGHVIENERDCPTYVSGITPGWWFTRGRLNSGPSIVQVKNTEALEYVVLRVGDENLTETVSEAVAVGVRFVAQVEFPEWI